MKLLPVDLKSIMLKIDNTPTVSNSKYIGNLDIYFYSNTYTTGQVSLWLSLNEIKSNILRTEDSESLRRV